LAKGGPRLSLFKKSNNVGGKRKRENGEYSHEKIKKKRGC